MRNRKRRPRTRVHTLVIAAAVLLAIVLPGCDTGKLPPISDTAVDLTPTEELVIYIPADFDDSKNWMSAAAADYQQAYPGVDVTSSIINYNDYAVRLRTELMAGSGPDLLFPQAFGANTAKNMESGMFLNLTDIMAKDEDFRREDYVEAVLDGGVYRGRQYIVPLSFKIDQYVSSKTKLRELGFDASRVTDTVSFLNEAAAALPKAETNPSFAAMFPSFFSFGWFCESSGLELIDWEKREVLPDKAGFKAFCEAYKPLYANDYRVTGKVTKSFGGPGLYADIETGDVVFWRSYATGYLHNASNLNAKDECVTIVPTRRDGGLQAGTYNCISINANSKNQYNAYNFIKLLLSPALQDPRPSAMIPEYPVRKESLAKRVNTLGMSQSDLEQNSVVDHVEWKRRPVRAYHAGGKGRAVGAFAQREPLPHAHLGYGRGCLSDGHGTLFQGNKRP